MRIQVSSAGKKQITKKNKIAPENFFRFEKSALFSLLAGIVPEFLFSQKRVGILIFFI